MPEGRHAGKTAVLFFKTVRRRFGGLWWSLERRSSSRQNSRRTDLPGVAQLAGHDVSQRLQRDRACDRVVEILRRNLRGIVGCGRGARVDFIRPEGTFVVAGCKAAVSVPPYDSSPCAKR